LASSISTALTVTLWDHETNLHHAVLVEKVADANPAANAFLNTLAPLTGNSHQTLGIVNNIVSREAATLAVNNVFLGCAVLFIAVIPLMWLARPPFEGAQGAVPH
jgi:DHA2 family multidrug resistance protein